MRRLPRISDAEWLVMKVLWSTPGLTADDVVEGVKGQSHLECAYGPHPHQPATPEEGPEVREGGAAGTAIFPPSIRSSASARERRSFVQRVYSGTITPMLAAFIDDADLSPEDIQELKRVLDRKGKE